MYTFLQINRLKYLSLLKFENNERFICVFINFFLRKYIKFYKKLLGSTVTEKETMRSNAMPLFL